MVEKIISHHEVSGHTGPPAHSVPTDLNAPVISTEGGKGPVGHVEAEKVHCECRWILKHRDVGIEDSLAELRL